MICARCHHAILPGEDYEVVDKPSASGCGTTLCLHRSCPLGADRAPQLPSALVHPVTQRGRVQPRPGAPSTQEEA